MIVSAEPARGPLAGGAPEGSSRRLSVRAVAVRLFLTCWLVYSIHLATNSVREIYPALSLGDHFSFRVDEYAGMHPDLFEKQGFGWHINSNPGASMLAAVPYALARPLVDKVVAQVNRQRKASQAEPPVYDSPWPMAREFFRQAWLRGLDVKLGLAAVIMQTLCMAPISAAGVVGMFFLLRRLFGSDSAALWLSVLYAFGTPVFFRAGYLNHNMILGHIVFLGFVILCLSSPDLPAPAFGAGVAGGLAMLLDYSGIVPLIGLFAFAVLRNYRGAFRSAASYALGAAGPIALLWFYQWRSFGNPFLPAQRWMPPVQFHDVGYQGFGWIQADLLWANLFDYRFGLFTSAPVLLLALLGPWLARRGRALPARTLGFCLALAAGFWLFASAVSYAHLQFNTGVRYLAPAVPFVFVPACVVLLRLPRRLAYLLSACAVFQGWSMAMYRDVERGLGVLDPLVRVLTGGFTVPVLTVLSRMGAQYGDYFKSGVSPLPLFLFVGAILYGLWSPRFDGGFGTARAYREPREK